MTRCKFPIGEPNKKDFKFCEDKAGIGSPYCDEHHELCYVCTKNFVFQKETLVKKR